MSGQQINRLQKVFSNALLNFKLIPVLQHAACISQYSGIVGSITNTRSPCLISAAVDSTLAVLKRMETRSWITEDHANYLESCPLEVVFAYLSLQCGRLTEENGSIHRQEVFRTKRRSNPLPVSTQKPVSKDKISASILAFPSYVLDMLMPPPKTLCSFGSLLYVPFHSQG